MPLETSSSIRTSLPWPSVSKSTTPTALTSLQQPANPDEVSTYPHIWRGPNLSFSFRGNDAVREAMHSVFLVHAISAGMRIGIVNPAQLAIHDELDSELRDLCTDVVLNTRSDATDRLLAAATRFSSQHDSSTAVVDQQQNRPSMNASRTPSSPALPNSSKLMSKRHGQSLAQQSRSLKAHS